MRASLVSRGATLEKDAPCAAHLKRNSGTARSLSAERLGRLASRDRFGVNVVIRKSTYNVSFRESTYSYVSFRDTSGSTAHKLGAIMIRFAASCRRSGKADA